tara:strand:- start:2357 stop:2524 length:168 start_codon:yes stop_codon:yes gene_type:complete
MRKIKEKFIGYWKECLFVLRRVAERMRSQGSAAIAFVKKKIRSVGQRIKRKISGG